MEVTAEVELSVDIVPGDTVSVDVVTAGVGVVKGEERR